LSYPTIGTLVNPVDAFAGLSRIHPTKAPDKTGNRDLIAYRVVREERTIPASTTGAVLNHVPVGIGWAWRLERGFTFTPPPGND